MASCRGEADGTVEASFAYTEYAYAWLALCIIDIQQRQDMAQEKGIPAS